MMMVVSVLLEVTWPSISARAMLILPLALDPFPLSSSQFSVGSNKATA